jgi:amino acid adenylation domain-containing protein
MSSTIRTLPERSEQEKLVHVLFEETVSSMPNATAIQYEGSKTITYDELNHAINTVARQLVCGRGSFVPILVQRSPQLVIAMLAVMKTGAAYVILSPEAPQERNEFILRDIKAPFIITDATTSGQFVDVPELRIDSMENLADGVPSDNLNTWMAPQEHAYVIYTSGTTGKPKGVLLSHKAAYTGLAALPKPANASPLRQLLCHSPNFSAAQRTILGTLVRGGTLCLASKEALTLNLHDTIVEMNVTTLEITPSMLKLMPASSVPPSVKKINLGGEVVSSALVALWGHRVELTNAYGLSECTQLNMRHRLIPGKSSRLVGRPSDATSAFLLKPDSMEFVLPGGSGELCLAGPQLADGYLNLPEKTSQAFTLSPFGNGNIYRTGDMAILHLDGSFELIGRVDNQTKIDGQRVEPNEPNAILETCPDVKMSAVVAADVLERHALVAIVVPREEDCDWPVLVRNLRQKLRKELPPYCIPSFWVQRERLPLNVSGKVDIAALIKLVQSLPEYELISRSNSPKITPPLTPEPPSASDFFEATIAKSVAQTLSISLDTVDLDCAFQELGGTSLNAIVLASELRKINIQIAVSSILTSPSLRQLIAETKSFETVTAEKAKPFSLLPEKVRLDRKDLDDAYPVTPLQEGIIADSILGNADYVYQRVFKLNGVSASQVRDALQQVVNQNSIFRSSIKSWKRTFLQLVRKELELPWTEKPHTTLEQYRRTDVNRQSMPLDGPLLRAVVLKGNLLVVDMHHALFDFWSSQFIFADTVTLLEGKQPELRMPFSAYVSWQQLQHNNEAENFWSTYLAGASPTKIEFSSSNKIKATQMLKLPFKRSPLSFCTSHNITLGTLVHAAWALTLAQRLKTPDVTFITAFSGRDAPIEGILSLGGPTLCTVPMRVQIERNQEALAFVKEVQNNLWKLSRYAHSGLRQATGAAKIEPSNFNTMVNMLVNREAVSENALLVPQEVHGDNYTQYPTIEVEDGVEPFAKFLGQQVALDIAKSLLQDFVNAIDFIMVSSDRPLEKFLMPTSKVVTEISEFGLAHAAFEEHARVNPSKPAIRTSTGSVITYAELNGKANSLAKLLSNNGSIHGEMIPLYMEKSATTLISILGIIKAGASFVPLDPKNPHDRNSFIIRDVKAKRLVTDRKNQEVASSFGVDLVIPDNLQLDSSTENLSFPEVTPESIIYAIYTSGSTGLPKGVLVQHAAVSASTEGMIEATAVTSDWNALWVLNYVFDASYYDVFTIFTAGATICVAPQDEVLSNLAGFINTLKVEQVMLTPTITKLISGGPSQVPGLKVLNVCGERIDTNILKWAESIDVYNGYGPTEATILMTVSKVQPNGSLNSIGFPLKHAIATIVPAEGNDLQPVDEGVIGELCVAGPHLAQGYLNSPEQTAKAFVKHPDGTQIYRTGDLARWNEDGSLECFGRKDYQVKVNGFRIELGEIENAIIRTDIVEAVVVSVAELQGKRQLVAFIIFKDDRQYKSENLLPPESRLQKVEDLMSQLTTISHYMMPSFFLPFGRFPTLPSGKTNRKELVAFIEKMDRGTLTSYLPSVEGQEILEPVTTEEEIIMQQAWVAVLGEEEDSIGANSSFLGLGGDSISAINVVAECRKLGYTISVADVLSHNFLGEQAKHLVSAANKAPKLEVKFEIPQTVISAVRNAGLDLDNHIEDIFPCGPGQTEFLIQGHKEHQFWNLTASRELPKGFNLELWRETTKQLTARNAILRTMYYLADPKEISSWYQIVLKEPVMNWEYMLYNSEAQKLKLMHELRDSQFSFGTPNIKYRLLESETDGSRTICIKVDHGSYDGTLLRIFDDQFTAIAQGRSEVPSVYPFKEFVEWVARTGKESALDYWRKTIGDWKPIHNLPSEPVTDKLKFSPISTDVEPIALKYGVTASTVFQAAYAILVAHLNDSNDVLVDNLLTGRNADVEDPQMLNGTCANFLPFRSTLQSQKSVSQFLKDTQAMFWDTTEHGAVGLSDIYAELGKDRQTYSSKLL